MNNIKPYENYKPSGITWLGDIPKDWEVRKLKFVLYLQRGHDLSKEHFISGDYPVYGSNGVIGYHNKFTTNAPCITIGRSGSVGKINFIKSDFWAHNTCLFVKKSNGNEWRYLWYLIITIDINRVSNGSAVPTLDRKNVHELEVAYTSLSEQTAIANFLDYKTTKIDRFIRKKKQLIKLLNEQKAGIINDAVTKGVNPKAKMKPSGIKWLGDIPEHWEMRKLKGVLSKEKGALKPGPFGSDLKNIDIISSGYKVYNQRAVLDHDFTISEECISPNKFEDLKVFEVLAGDILLTTRGTIGKCCIIPSEFEKGIIHPCIIRLRIDVNIVSHQFVKLFIEQASSFKIALKLNSNATTIDVIYGDTLKDIFFVVPPIQEQKLIISHIEKETATIDKTIATIEKEITLVQEYRTALIAEAVTGKIDVRDYVFSKIAEDELYEEMEDELNIAAEDEAEYENQEIES